MLRGVLAPSAFLSALRAFSSAVFFFFAISRPFRLFHIWQPVAMCSGMPEDLHIQASQVSPPANSPSTHAAYALMLWLYQSLYFVDSLRLLIHVSFVMKDSTPNTLHLFASVLSPKLPAMDGT